VKVLGLVVDDEPDVESLFRLRKALDSGAEALLTKPIDFGALRNEIASRMGRAA